MFYIIYPKHLVIALNMWIWCPKMPFPCWALRCHYVYARWISAFMKWLLQLCFCNCFPAGFKFHIPIFINREREREGEKLFIKKTWHRTGFWMLILRFSNWVVQNDLILSHELLNWWLYEIQPSLLLRYNPPSLHHSFLCEVQPFLLFRWWRPADPSLALSILQEAKATAEWEQLPQNVTGVYMLQLDNGISGWQFIGSLTCFLTACCKSALSSAFRSNSRNKLGIYLDFLEQRKMEGAIMLQGTYLTVISKIPSLESDTRLPGGQRLGQSPALGSLRAYPPAYPCQAEL